jgi:hypothetical protein
MNMQASWELEAAEDQLGSTVRRDVLPPDGVRGAEWEISRIRMIQYAPLPKNNKNIHKHSINLKL